MTGSVDKRRAKTRHRLHTVQAMSDDNDKF